MILFLHFIVLGMFFLKLLWNVLTPFVLAWRGLTGSAKNSGGISMCPFIEIALWLLLIVFSIVIDGAY
jgi:hypothetical protein